MNNNCFHDISGGYKYGPDFVIPEDGQLYDIDRPKLEIKITWFQ